MFHRDIPIEDIFLYLTVAVEHRQTNKSNSNMPSLGSIENGFIKTSFLMAARREEFHHRWMSTETWAKLIVKYSIVDSSLIFNGEQLEKCLNSRENKGLREEMELRTMISKDHVGIFREQMRKKGSTKKCSYYYATTPGQSPLEKEKKWYDCINDAEDLLSKKITRASETLLPVSSITQQPAKKRKLKTSEEQAPEDKPLESAIIIGPISSSVHHRLAADTPYDYFDSPEARILFAANENEDTRQSIRAQIAVLSVAQEGEDGYLSIIEGGEEIDEEMLSNHTKHSIRQKSLILTLSLNLALEQMNGWTWGKCCDAAIKVAIRMGVSITRNADTVKRWYRNFRAKRKVAVPVKQKHNLPPFLELNPDICSALKTFACSNLNILSIEMMEFQGHCYG